jgi:hypothetical protein
MPTNPSKGVRPRPRSAPARQDEESRASLFKSTSESEQEDETQMRPHAGDRITIESEKVAQPGRAGVIEEVLQEDPPRLRVRWEDGHSSILTPSAGAARVTHEKTRARA